MCELSTESLLAVLRAIPLLLVPEYNNTTGCGATSLARTVIYHSSYVICLRLDRYKYIHWAGGLPTGMAVVTGTQAHTPAVVCIKTGTTIHTTPYLP